MPKTKPATQPQATSATKNSGYVPPASAAPAAVQQTLQQPVQVNANPAADVRTFWEDPQAVARYYNYARGAAPGATMPDWMDKGKLTQAYKYLQIRNNFKPWQDWAMLPNDDPGKSFLQSIPEPPAPMKWPSDWSSYQPQQPAPSTEKPFGDWDQLNPWQQIVLGIFSPQPGIAGRPEWTRYTAAAGQGVLGALGGAAAGAALGSAIPGLGTAAGAVAGGLLMGGTQAYQALTSTEVPVLGQALAITNLPAQWLEQSVGLIGQAGSEGLDTVLKNLPAAWEASQATYETQQLDLLNAVALVAGDQPAGPGQVWQIQKGISEPVDINGPRGEAALADARNRMVRGEDWSQVYADVVDRFGFSGTFNDFVQQTILDPMNLLGFFEGKIGAKVGDLTGNPRLAEAMRMNTGSPLIDALPFGVKELAKKVTGLEESKGLMAGLETYKSMIRTGYSVNGAAPAPAAQLTDFEKSIAGLTKTGEVKELQPASGKTGVSGFVEYLSSLTPASKAEVFISQLRDNFSALVDLADKDPDRVIQLLRQAAQVDPVAVGQAGEALVQSPSMATVSGALREAVSTGIADEMLAQWKSAEPRRLLLDKIAQMTGEKPADILREMQDNPDALIRRINEAAPVLGTPDHLRETLGVFVGDDPLPWSADQWVADLTNTVFDRVGDYVVQRYGITTDPAIFRINNVLKSAQSLLLLNFNPGYFINNELNNLATRAAVGVFGFMAPGQIDGFLSRFGIKPDRMEAATAPGFEDVGLGANAKVAEARRGGDAIARAQGVVSALGDKLGAFAKVSQKFEAMESRQAFAIGMTQFWRQAWKEGKGFRKLPADLEARIERAAPGMTRAIYAAVAAGMNMREVSSALLGEAIRPQISEVLDSVAAQMNVNPDIAKTLFNQTGIREELEKSLADAKTPGQVDAAFNRVEEKLTNYVREIKARSLIHRAEESRNLVQSERIPAVLEMHGELEIRNAETWLNGRREWQDLYSRRSLMDDSAWTSAVRDLFGKQDRDWDEYYKYELQTVKGVIQALGLEGESGDYINDLIEAQKNWQSFHQDANKKRQEYFSQHKRKPRETWEQYRARDNQAWNKLQDELEDLYTKHTEMETKIQTRLDERFSKQYQQFTGWDPTKAKQWRQDIRDRRYELVNMQKSMRRLTRDMLPAERDAAYAQFNQEYNRLIAEMKQMEITGAANLVDPQTKAVEELKARWGNRINDAVPPSAAPQPGTEQINAALDIDPQLPQVVRSILGEALKAGITDRGGKVIQPYVLNIINKRQPEGEKFRSLADVPYDVGMAAIAEHQRTHAHEQAQRAAALQLNAEDIIRMADQQAREAEITANAMMTRRAVREQLQESFGASDDEIEAVMLLMDLHADAVAERQGQTPSDATRDAWYATHVAEIVKSGGDSDAYNSLYQLGDGDFYRGILGEPVYQASLTPFGSGKNIYYVISSTATNLNAPRFANAEDGLKWAKENGFDIVKVRDQGYGNKGYDLVHPKTKLILDHALEAQKTKWDNAEDVFIRFSKPPQSGKSYNYASGEYEPGVSVYRGKQTANGEVKVFPSTPDELWGVMNFKAHGVDIFVVSGKEIGVGSDGEPLLENVKIIRKVNPNQLRQSSKGSVEFLSDGRAVIRALSAPDISTMVHEVGHIFRRDLPDKDLNTIAHWSGLQSAEEYRTLQQQFQNGELAQGSTNYRRYVDAEEKFARGWELYLAEGDAPTPALRNVFARFTDWMVRIYKNLRAKIGGGITGTGLQEEFTVGGRTINLDAEVDGVKIRDIFDSIITNEPDRPQVQTPEIKATPAPILSAQERTFLNRPSTLLPDPVRTAVRQIGDQMLKDLTSAGSSASSVTHQAQREGGAAWYWSMYDSAQNKSAIKRQIRSAIRDIIAGTEDEKNVTVQMVKTEMLQMLTGEQPHDLGDYSSPAALYYLGRKDILFSKFADQFDTASEEWLRQQFGGDGSDVMDQYLLWSADQVQDVKPLQERINTAQAQAQEATQRFEAGEPVSIDDIAGLELTPGDPLSESPAIVAARAEVLKGLSGDDRAYAEAAIDAFLSGVELPASVGSIRTHKSIDNLIKKTFAQTFSANENSAIGVNTQAKPTSGLQVLRVHEFKHGDYVIPAAVYQDGKLVAYLPNSETVEPFATQGGDARVLGLDPENADQWVVERDGKTETVDPKQPGKGQLYQMGSNDPTSDVPLGGTPATEPYGDVLAETANEHLGPMLRRARDQFKDRLAEQPLKIGGLDGDTQREIRRYLNQVGGDMASTKLAAMKYGEQMRDSALLNYTRKYGIDNYLNLIFPYQFWYTRSMVNWAKRMIDRPSWFSLYARMQQTQEKMQRDGMPTRLKGQVRIPAPWLPDWAGTGIYIDPMSKILPFDNFGQPLEQFASNKNQVEKRATSLLQSQVKAGEITAQQMSDAIANKSDAVWKRAQAQAEEELDKSMNPLSMASMMMTPALWWTTAQNIAQGTPEKISPLPLTRTAQSIRTATRGTPLEGIGSIVGLAAWPEERIRKAAGLSNFGEWGDYYIDRELANMAADGTITAEQAQTAMIQRSGDAFDEANRRVEYQQMLRTPGAATINQLAQGNVGGALQSLPTAAMGAGLFPEGELRLRGLAVDYNKAWYDYKNGDDEAINKFLEDNPEYESRLALYDEPGERLRQFLVSSIWDRYSALAKPNRSRAADALGQDFKDSFLDRETRSYDSLPVEQLAVWAQQLGQMLPKTTETQPAIDNPAPQPQYYSDAVTKGVEAYQAERDKKFPNYYAQQNLYYSYPQGSAQRKQVLSQFPELRQYWDWKKQYQTKHPEIQQYFDDNSAAAASNPQPLSSKEASMITAPLIRQILAQKLTGAQMGTGAMSELNRIARANGRSMNSEDYAQLILENMFGMQ